jgi:hypothetical protein
MVLVNESQRMTTMSWQIGDKNPHREHKSVYERLLHSVRLFLLRHLEQ